MLTGSIQRVIATFQNAFEALGARPPAEKIEALAILVYQAMTDEVRSYHRLEHVFDLLESGQPIRNLAALFHDLVYFQVDRGFSPTIAELLSPFLVPQEDGFLLAPAEAWQERPLRLLLRVFGRASGESLQISSGLNEFLSALVMVRQLQPVLGEADWVRIAACIEATIPFRGQDATGKGPFERLEERLLQLADEEGLALTPAQVVEAVQSAVIFANLDVSSFAHSDVTDFLSGTWKLLLEANQVLRARWAYTIRSYRQAIQSSEAFLSRLSPQVIFHRYRGVPSPEDLSVWEGRARQNLAIAVQYLRLKLVTIAILEALAEATGGDAPISLFMGDLPQPEEPASRLEHFLPPQERPPWVDATTPIFRLLETGRGERADFDLQSSPLTLYLYQSLSPAEFADHLALARRFFAGELTPDSFLGAVKRSLLADIARAAAEMVPTRRNRLLIYI